MKKYSKFLILGGLLAVANTSSVFAQKTALPNPAASAPPAATAAAQRSDAPDLGATAFGLGTGIYGGLGFLGGALQIGATDWLRLSGGITGALPGDQVNFATSNYYMVWQFTGGLMFMGKVYRGFLRPYFMTDLTYFYDAKAKAGGLNGGFRVGMDLYMAQDWGIYIESGVNLSFARDVNAPSLVGGVVGIGARTFF